MHFGPNECTQCGNIRVPYTSNEYNIPSDGVLARLLGFECAFCSDKCLERALQPYITERFGFRKEAKNDPDIKSIIENLKRVTKLLDNGLQSNEERGEIQEHIAYHENALREAVAAWVDGQNAAIEGSISKFVSQWARECGKYNTREMETSFKEKKTAIERGQREQQRQQERDERERQRLQDKQERLAEAERRELERAHDNAHKEHEEFLDDEQLQQALQFKPIPDHIPVHTAIIANTGWGKTQLLQTLILDQLNKPDPPSMVILDSTGQMVGLIQRLAIFNHRLKDQILIVDPAYSPSLNMFDMSNPRFNSLTPEQKEDAQTEIVTLFNYIFSTQQNDLSGPMTLPFARATRLMLSRPQSTIHDLRKLLDEKHKSWQQSAYREDIEKLDENDRDFFINHFFDDGVRSTKAALARRIEGMLDIPAFKRMFLTRVNALDIYHETQDKGSIILVNTSEQLLKNGGYQLFGRYIIARTVAAIMERATIPRDKRRTTHLIVDEAGPYFDPSFDEVLTRVRQFGLKVTIAFQHFGQLSDNLKNSVAGQTNVKYAGSLSAADARFLSNNMRCEAEFLMRLNTDISKPPQWTEFGVYAQGMTVKHAMFLHMPFYAMEHQPMMTDEEHAQLLARNRARTNLAEKAPRPPSVPSADTVPPTTNHGGPDQIAAKTEAQEPVPKSPVLTRDPGEPSDSWGNN